MSSPGAASFSTLASYASSAPDRQEPHGVNLPGAYPGTATAPTITNETTYLTPASASSSSLNCGSPPPSSGRANNYNSLSIPSRNSHTPANSPPATPINIPNTPNPIRPRTATQAFALLPHLETGDAHSIHNEEQYRQFHRDDIRNHPIREFFFMSSSSFIHDYDIDIEAHAGQGGDDDQELGWRDAYEVMIKAPLRGLAALMARTGLGRRKVKHQKGGGIV